MDANDKRNNIIQTLQSTDDEQLIEEVYELVYPNEIIENISVDALPDELKNKIARALDDYQNGRYIFSRSTETKGRTMAYQLVWSAEAENDLGASSISKRKMVPYNVKGIALVARCTSQQ